MKRFVISAPRSGLNWIRYCTEHFLGLRTPGKTILLAEADEPGVAFERSHDALQYTRKSQKGAWQGIAPAQVGDGKLALILRDPLETYARAAHGKLRHFGMYAGNIHLFSQISPADRAVFYYGDLICKPSEMMRLFTHLQLTAKDGRPDPTSVSIAESWQSVSNASRDLYDVNHRGAGGAMTKADPTDFKFHQQGLDQAKKTIVWRYLRRILSDEEYALLARYQPDYEVKPQSFAQQLLDHFR